MRRQRDEWRDSSGSHYVYAACDDDNKKTAYQMLLKRKQRQRLHAGTPSGIYMAEREKYGKGEHTKQNKISTRLLSVCVCLGDGEGGRWKTKTCKAKAARHHTRPWREGHSRGEDCHMKGRTLCLSALRSVLHDARKSVKLNLIA